jgi:Protein kinase domain
MARDGLLRVAPASPMLSVACDGDEATFVVSAQATAMFRFSVVAPHGAANWTSHEQCREPAVILPDQSQFAGRTILLCGHLVGGSLNKDSSAILDVDFGSGASVMRPVDLQPVPPVGAALHDMVYVATEGGVAVFSLEVQGVVKKIFWAPIVRMTAAPTLNAIFIISNQPADLCEVVSNLTAPACGSLRYLLPDSSQSGDMFGGFGLISGIAVDVMGPVAALSPYVEATSSSLDIRVILGISGGAVAILMLFAFALVQFYKYRRHVALAPDISDVGGKAKIIASRLKQHSSRHEYETTDSAVSESLALLSGQELGGAVNVVEKSIRRGRFLSSGSFGRVYTCRIGNGRAQYAVKVASLLPLSPAEREQAKEMFEGEVELAAKLQHENICALVGWSQSPTSLFLIMELFDDTLAAVLEQRKHDERSGLLPWFSEDEVDENWEDLVAGLAYLHEQLIAHRDCKLSNILVERSGVADIKRLVWADFGISRTYTSLGSAKEAKTELGSSHYMAPEIVRDASYDAFAADVWALGLIGAALVTGSPEVEGVLTSSSHLRREGHERVQSWALASVCRSCLDPSPRHRPTLHELKQDPLCPAPATGSLND